MKVEKISAITLGVANMRTSVQFYRDVLGMEVLYGGKDWQFSSLRAKGAKDPILNLEQGRVATPWGRLIFYVPDVDEFSSYLKAKGFQTESPRDGSCGERYFHLYDPDGHELSFARPIR
jgi:catechol 2,3-dioxygenase-like lactoylglutathione lyase family enzyme